ncbi:MAG: hypothetical protein GY810_04420, partial [Aureispira sp.]|nr:hypothetical protein [Aureispira sp.]
KSILGKEQSYALELLNSSFVKVEGFKFFATTFQIYNSSDCSVEDCLLAYPNCSKRMLLNEAMPVVSRIYT